MLLIDIKGLAEAIQNSFILQPLYQEKLAILDNLPVFAAHRC